MNTIRPEYLIAYLFKSCDDLMIDTSKLHSSIYLLKKKVNYSEFLKKYRFKGSPVNPYSNVIDEALFNLQFAGHLSRQNPDLILYSKTDSFETFFENIQDNITDQQKSLLEELSSEILRNIN